LLDQSPTNKGEDAQPYNKHDGKTHYAQGIQKLDPNFNVSRGIAKTREDSIKEETLEEFDLILRGQKTSDHPVYPFQILALSVQMTHHQQLCHRYWKSFDIVIYSSFQTVSNITNLPSSIKSLPAPKEQFNTGYWKSQLL